MDRISKLPAGIIENIVLCLLPIQEAARTSVISREWMDRWTKIPRLAFIEDTFQVSTDGEEMPKRCKLFSAIYQVLLRHEGPIHEFTLSVVADRSCVEIDHILLHLSKNYAIKKLKLDFNGSYTLPLSFFSLHQLTDLYLNHCALELRPSFNGFCSLTTLHLQEIQTSKKALLRLLSSCPLLKRLALMSDAGTIGATGDSTIADLFVCLHGIEYLSLTFFIFLCFPPLPKELPTSLVHLKYLCMEWVWLRHKYTVPFLVLLIRSTPNLEKLKLELCVDDDLFDESQMGSFTLEGFSDITLEHLNELEILNFSDEENELDFVKFILAKSPVLKKVRILLRDPFDEDEKLEISEIILRSPCASPVVKIIVS